MISVVPVFIALPLFACVFAAAAILVHTSLRRFLPPPEQLRENHDVAGFIMGVTGVLYSVVLGFLVGTVWTAFASAQQTSDLEAGYIADTFNFAVQLPAPYRPELQRTIAQYAIAVRDSGSSAIQSDHSDSTGALLYRAVRIAVSVQPPSNAGAAQILETNAIRAELIDTLRRLSDMRRLRVVQARSRWPAGMLEALVLGAIGVMAFTFFFGVKSYARQMALTGLLAASIGLFFGLIVELSTPYTGAIQVSRDALTSVITDNHLADFSK